jgi:hypothetical protein
MSQSRGRRHADSAPPRVGHDRRPPPGSVAASPRVTAAAPTALNHPADLSYDLVIGNGTTVSERATWHFAVE